MKWPIAQKTILAVGAGLALLISGCGSSSVNVVTVTVSPSAQRVLAGQTQTFTATVGGSATTTVTDWPCTYSYTPAPTMSNPNPKAVTGTCTSGGTVPNETGSFGTWTISTANGSNVLTYVAPSLANFPNPNIPTLSFAATADADKKKTATATVGLDSGIRVSILPATATVPVGLSPAQGANFNVSFQNSPPVNAQFKLVQPNTASTTIADQTPNPLSDTCTVTSPTMTAPGCGSIDANGHYTAPVAVPTDTVPAGSKSTTPTTVYVVAWSAADTSHYALGTITLVNATTNPVTFSGLYPDTVAAGGILQDVFLDAKNLLNTTQIVFIRPTSFANLMSGKQVPLNSTSQIFTIPISSTYCTPSASGVTPVVTCDASIMTRARLQADQLSQAEPDPSQPAWILIPSLPGTPTVTSPCVFFPGTTNSIACPLHIVNASPALVAAVPDSISQVSGNSTVQLAVDGGYYGVSGTLATLNFNGQTTALNTTLSGPRQLNGTTQSFQLPNPGLYEVTVNSNTTQGTPPLFKTVITNTAVQPNFAIAPAPASIPLIAAGQPAVNLAPSAMALNSVKGYAVIAEQANDSLQFVDLTGTFPTVQPPFSLLTAAPTSSAPTDIAIDNQLQVNGGDLGVVVSSGDSTLYLYSITPGGANVFTFVKSISMDLRTLLGEPNGAGLPTPVSVGVDSSTHLGVVAYTNTNIGFIVDVNPNLDAKDTRTCFVAGQVPPCVIGPVSIVTGASPKVVMQPNVPLAYVTPGGGIGNTSVVDLLQQGKSAPIAPFVSGGTSGAVRTAGITKIITTSPHGINPVLGGTVIISGITATKPMSNFNGTFQVLPGSVLDPYTFSYAQIGQPDDTESNPTNMPGTVQYGVPYFSFSTSTTVSGAAINPVTRTFGYADYNQASAQIGFISTLDQTFSSLSLTTGSCSNPSCVSTGAPETGFRSVAFDPFTNVMVAYAPTENTDPNQNGNKVSLINPGGPTANGLTNFPTRIIAAIPTGQVGKGSYTPTGQTAAIAVYGPMAYDPKSRFVLVANAGSNTLTYMNLDTDPNRPFQKAHIQDLQLFDSVPAYGVPVLQPPLSSSKPSHAPTSCSLVDPTQPCMPQAVRVGGPAKLRILGQGFTTISNPVVRLDGQNPINPTSVTDSEVDFTIPAASLLTPHDYALDLQSANGGDATNEIDLHVVGLLDMATGILPTGMGKCVPTSSFPQGPEGVAIDGSRHIALVTNYACNSVSVISIDTTGALAPFGTIIGTVTVGNQPTGVAVIPRLGYAVVTNGGDTPSGTASIIDIHNPASPQIVPISTTSGSTTTTTNSVTVGLLPLGVAIDQDRALALVANNGSNTLSSIDLTVLLPSDPPKSNGDTGHVKGSPVATTVALSGPPTAIAIDPNRPVAVVTNLQNSGTTSVTGGMDVISLAISPPVKNSTASVSSLAASLTGIVYDPGDPNNTSVTTTGLFYATSTQSNAIYSFNPDTSSVQTVRVGINPFSLGYNYETGTLLTINSTSNTSSVVDVQNFKTRQTLGISSMSQFAIDVDNLTNIAVIVDQNNNRVVFLALPK